MQPDVVSGPEALAHRYAAAVDARDWDAAADLFADDGELVRPDPPDHLGPTHTDRGRAAVRAALAVLEATDRTHHDVGDVAVEVRGEVATGRVACVAHHVVGARCVDWQVTYVDDYTCDGGAWRFRRRELYLTRVISHEADPPADVRS